MSATGRNLPGRERRPDDYYATPEWLTRALCDALLVHHFPFTSKILEPAIGDGAIARVLREYHSRAHIHGVDIRDVPRDPRCDVLTIGDFLALEPRPEFDLIVTNPPYSLAFEYVYHALQWRRAPTSLVCMLLRLNFLGGQRRATWLRSNTPSVYVTPRRPSFTGDGTDATEYAWFVWGPGEPTVTILPTETHR